MSLFVPMHRLQAETDYQVNFATFENNNVAAALDAAAAETCLKENTAEAPTGKPVSRIVTSPSCCPSISG